MSKVLLAWLFLVHATAMAAVALAIDNRGTVFVPEIATVLIAALIVFGPSLVLYRLGRRRGKW